MKLKTKFIALLALASTALVIPANAAVTFAAGDLILAVRSATEGKTFMVNLGAATTYRDATADNKNIVNIKTDLDANFVGWQNRGDVRWGIFGVRSNLTSAPVVDGDPGQAIYVSRAQNPVGVQETAWGVAGQTISSTNHGSAAGSMVGIQSNFANGTATPNLTNATVLNDADTLYDTIGGTWGAFTNSGGTQGTFANGTGATGLVSGFEFGETTGAALDLFRSLGTTLGANPTGTARVGSYEGSFRINDLGVVGYSYEPTFQTIPEPSRALLLGLSATGLLFRRRRAVHAA